MIDPNKLTLLVAGQIYEGWKEVTVRTGIEQLAGIFELAITERWPNQQTEWNIPPGERCTVKIGEDILITGYVDSVGVSYDANSHEIKVIGRDAAGDLVDCSAPSVAYSGLTFVQIAEKLCQPYGIAVHDETVKGKKLTAAETKSGKQAKPPKTPRISSAILKAATQNGESVFKTLEKLARSEGVLLVSDGEGGLVVTRAGLGGEAESALEWGKNILRANSDHSHANLYSEITVKGQASAGAGKYDVTHAHPKATVSRKAAQASNTQITRHRPLIIVAESQADAKRCRQRAEWEASNREAKARRITLTVQGWRQASGVLWRINQMAPVKCPWMRTDEKWLIAAISYKLDDKSGTTSELTLTSDKAFDLLPEIPPALMGADAGKYKVVGAAK